MNLDERSNEQLLSDVTRLVDSHRELTARLVAHLSEIENRSLHLLAGFSSMFEFCTKALRLGEGEPFRRVLAARLGRRFPVVLLTTRLWKLEPLDARASSRMVDGEQARGALRCRRTYVAKDGRRCEARAFLELDHAEPKALGGTDDARNLRVRCRAHNQLWAEQVFGRERVEGSRHFCQKKSTSHRQVREPGPGAMTTFDKLHSALRGVGFRDVEARKAVATVRRMHDANEAVELEQVLRAAVLVATAA